MAQQFIPGVLEEIENINFNRLRNEVDKNFFRGGIERLRILQGPIKIDTGDTSGLLVWDVGDWDDANWANLNTGDMTGIRIINPDNVFYEPYLTDAFIDSTASTASPSGGTITLPTEGVIQSTIIALNNVVYTFARMKIITDDPTVFTLQLSFDGGSNWETVTSGKLHTSTNGTTSGLKYKITNDASSSATFPLTFPFSFSGSSVFEEVQISYG